MPETEIIILNTDFKTKYADGIRTAALCYGIKCVELYGIDKIDGHPTEKGMAEIARQIAKTEQA